MIDYSTIKAIETAYPIFIGMVQISLLSPGVRLMSKTEEPENKREKLLLAPLLLIYGHFFLKSNVKNHL